MTTLQRKPVVETEAERRLVKALEGRRGALTRADAATLTGLSTDAAEASLKSLLGKYKSHLAVTEQGELLYSFDPGMVRRDAVTLQERMAELGRALWKGFTVLFKVTIAVTLVVYVAAFVAMLIALMFARTASDRDDRRSDRGGGGGFPWMIWWLMPDWAPVEARRQLPQRGGPRKRFYLSVFDFVFGPKEAKPDLLAPERELVGYLRAKSGRITATDLVALTGWSYERAEEEATRLLADYDGEPEITEDGTIVYSFPQLRLTAGGVQSEPWRYTWQERRALAPLTGNTPGTNTVIGLMNAFNLVGGAAIGPAFLMRFGLYTPELASLVISFPLVFSSVFFAVPAGRWLKQKRTAQRLVSETLRAEFLREIVSRRGQPLDPKALAAQVEQRVPGAGTGQAAKILERLLRDLDGDVTTDESGAMRYVFPRVTEELTAAEAARTLAPAAEESPGQVVFSSTAEDEPPTLEEATSRPLRPRLPQ
ncbi:MAG TPA: hypothetical protein VH877_00540 [Polyangia bacterium]|nr:hypothetical protein [Polyangia bacterium]